MAVDNACKCQKATYKQASRHFHGAFEMQMKDSLFFLRAPSVSLWPVLLYAVLYCNVFIAHLAGMLVVDTPLCKQGALMWYWCAWNHTKTFCTRSANAFTYETKIASDEYMYLPHEESLQEGKTPRWVTLGTYSLLLYYRGWHWVLIDALLYYRATKWKYMYYKDGIFLMKSNFSASVTDTVSFRRLDKVKYSYPYFSLTACVIF